MYIGIILLAFKIEGYILRNKKQYGKHKEIIAENEMGKRNKQSWNWKILRKLNKIQIKAVPDKEKEITRLTAKIRKEKESVEQMKSQFVKLQAESKNMNVMNKWQQ